MAGHKLSGVIRTRRNILIPRGQRIRSGLIRTVSFALLATATNAQVSVSYRPTTLAPGVPNEITITLTDDSGNGVEITSVAFTFRPPQGLTLDENGFTWGQFADSFSVDESIPQPAASTFGAGENISANGSLDIAVVTVTPDATLAGTENVELPTLPDDAGDAAAITGSTFEVLDITAGRVAIFTVADSADSQSQGGDGDSPTEDGGGSEPSDPADGPDSGTGDIDAGDGQDDTVTDPDDDGTDPDDATGTVDTGDGDTPGGDGQTDDEDDGTTDTPPDSAGDSAEDETAGPTTTTTVCGLGMLGPGLFTMALLSVMKLSRRRVS